MLNNAPKPFGSQAPLNHLVGLGGFTQCYSRI